MVIVNFCTNTSEKTLYSISTFIGCNQNTHRANLDNNSLERETGCSNKNKKRILNLCTLHIYIICYNILYCFSRDVTKIVEYDEF